MGVTYGGGNLIYSIIVIVFVLFLSFTLIYPRIYLKPLTVVSLVGDKSELLSMRYSKLRKFHRVRYGDFYVYLRADDDLPFVKLGASSFKGEVYICSIGYFRKSISVDPSSNTLKSILK